MNAPDWQMLLKADAEERKQRQRTAVLEIERLREEARGYEFRAALEFTALLRSTYDDEAGVEKAERQRTRIRRLTRSAKRCRELADAYESYARESRAMNQRNNGHKTLEGTT